MEDFIKKITSYQLFNNLYPGVLLWTTFRVLFSFQVENGGIITTVFVCYFLGMVVSRVGSLLIEPIVKHFVEWSDKSDYVAATKRDSAIQVLMQEANTYRTLSALGMLITPVLITRVASNMAAMCLAFYRMSYDYSVLLNMYPFVNVLLLISSAGITILFAISYVKQLRHICQRIRSAVDGESKE